MTLRVAVLLALVACASEPDRPGESRDPGNGEEPGEARISGKVRFPGKPGKPQRPKEPGQPGRPNFPDGPGRPKYPQPEDPPPYLTLGETEEYASAPVVAVVGSTVYVAWEGAGTYAGEILFRRSDDGGRTFQPAVNLSDTPESSREPALAARDDRAYVGWHEGGDRGGLLLRASIDRGRSFGATTTIAGKEVAGYRVYLAASAERVHAIWEVGDDELGQVFVRSTEYDGSWMGAPLKVNAGYAYGTPNITAGDDTVWAVWDDYGTNDAPRIFLSVSDNAGLQFREPELVSIDPRDPIGLSRDPVVVASGDEVAVLWEERASVFPYPTVLRWRRGTFTAGLGGVETLATAGTSARLAAHGRTLYLLDRTAPPELITSPDFGGTFSTPRPLPDLAGGEGYALAAGPEGAVVAWIAGTEIRFARIE
jgi:hypothetical protein